MLTIRFSDNLSNGVPTLRRSSKHNFDFDEENAEPSKHKKMVFDAAFGRHTAWDRRLGGIINRQPELSDSTIKKLDSVLIYRR